MSKRLSKEELESDPLIENYNRAVSFYQTNRTAITSIAIALIVVIGGTIGWNYYTAQQENEAQSLLSIAESYYMRGEYEAALYGDDFELTYGFEQIADEYSGTNAGNMANYYASVSSYELGDIGNALEFIQEFDVPEGILGVGPLSFHANLLLENENYDAAAEKYIEAAQWDQNDMTTPLNLYKAAQAYYEADNYDRAEELTSRIIEEYPNSNQLVEAQKLRGMIAANN
ncbi:tetratricopeptide repeat protein [Gracilimonas mengyeensis]|uniref:Tetratricopeptide repeat-containing protein n=1 Tax=Gracilimonas mengyeensis TaxID=1302730 RepID=A0A521EXK1_9BACT|nr:tetratricopeptide repeat protein [Gracilimonas mengyeensis]SMO88635.1 Tetratricopeptide repeat-containing protein [Gracilimonas mengyeensis]